jgi:hypothetical protein
MNMKFERGDRVQHAPQSNNSRMSGKQGTVTHFHGDPGYNLGAGPHNEEVWVRFDSGYESWVEVELLVKL